MHTTMLDLETLSVNANATARHYWQKRLAGLEPGCYFEPGGQAARPAHYQQCRLPAPAGLSERLSAVALTDKARHLVLLAAVGVLAHKYSAQEQVLLFTPPYRDSGPGGQQGSVVPVRLNPLRQVSFRQLIQQLQAHWVEDLAHAHYPLHKILPSHAARLETLPAVGVLVEDVQPAWPQSGLEAELVFAFRVQGSLSLQVHYKAGRYEASYVGQLARRCWQLLADLLAHNDQPIGKIELLGEGERRQLLEGFNDTQVDYPAHHTLVSLFEQQVRRSPRQVALHYRHQRLSYQQLHEQSQRLAAYLREEMGVKTGQLVALLLEREPALLVSLLAILKAGAAYLPLDPLLPPARLEALLAHAQPKALLSRRRYLDGLAPHSTTSLDLDQVCLDELPLRPHALAAVGLSAHHPAYLIYTSGSTGQPKGVLVEHHSVVNRLLWMQKQYPLTSQDVLLQKTPITFDVSVWELFWWSFTGASLCLPEPGAEKDPRQLRQAIARYGVSRLHFVPSMLEVFLQGL
ncbi:MAG TPA: AMP-binding protein, partial [Cytophagales bacterium]